MASPIAIRCNLGATLQVGKSAELDSNGRLLAREIVERTARRLVKGAR